MTAVALAELALVDLMEVQTQVAVAVVLVEEVDCVVVQVVQELLL